MVCFAQIVKVISNFDKKELSPILFWYYQKFDENGTIKCTRISVNIVNFHISLLPMGLVINNFDSLIVLFRPKHHAPDFDFKNH